MSFIGRIIEEYRSSNKISRKELSENICTEKYIYLIEKGERNPSANLINLLGDRLGVDLFSYYEYLDCKNPIAVKRYIDRFEMYRARLEPHLLHDTTKAALELPDFSDEPWSFEIEINKLFYDIFAKYEYMKSIHKINSFLNRVGYMYSKGIYVANAYILLSTCYIFLGDHRNAKKASEFAYDAIGNKYHIKRYEKSITNIKVNIMTLSYLLGEYDNAIREGKEILSYKDQLESYDRVHYVFFYLAFSNYQKGQVDKAIEYFKKGIYLCLTNYREEDIKYIAMQDVFLKLINDERICKEVILEFNEKYNLSG